VASVASHAAAALLLAVATRLDRTLPRDLGHRLLFV
jgi:hypothetical protein